MKILSFIAIMVLLLVACAPAKAPVQVEKTPIPEKEGMAVLSVHAGEVFVNGKPASSGQELKEGDLVKTLNVSKATIVFFDSAVLRLDENTEVTVKKIVSDGRSIELAQSVGQTWSRILKVSGIREYSIETPNTIATVRGTGFVVKTSDGNTTVKVKEGKVHVAAYKEDKMIGEEMVPKDMQMEVSVSAEMELVPMEEDAWMEENVEADNEFVNEVVHSYMEEHSEVIAEMETHMTSEQVEDSVEALVTGETATLEVNTSEEAVAETNQIENATENVTAEVQVNETVNVSENLTREEVQVDAQTDIIDRMRAPVS